MENISYERHIYESVDDRINLPLAMTRKLIEKIIQLIIKNLRVINSFKSSDV